MSRWELPGWRKCGRSSGRRTAPRHRQREGLPQGLPLWYNAPGRRGRWAFETPSPRQLLCKSAYLVGGCRFFTTATASSPASVAEAGADVLR